MACDLMEPWRAHIDMFVWELFRDQVLRPEHFGSDGAGSCVIGKTGRSEFYKAWAGKQRLMARSLRRHSFRVGRSLVGNAVFPDCEDPEDGDQ